MTMELAEELPAMLGLFLCGAVGYVSVKYLHKRLGATAKLADKLRDPFFPEGKEEPIPESVTLVKRQAKKKARRRAPASSEAPTEQEEPVTPASAELDESSIDDGMRVVSATEEPAPMSDRVAKLLAKKAARKARKAEVMQAPVHGDASAEPTAEAACAEAVDAGNKGGDALAPCKAVKQTTHSAQELVATAAVAQQEAVAEEQVLEEESNHEQDEARRHWAEWTDDDLPPVEQEAGVCAFVPAPTVLLNQEDSCATSYGDWGREDLPSSAEFRPRPWERFAPGATDFERPKANWDEEWWGPPRRQATANEDNWMTPFDELIQGSCFHVSTPMTPASSGVCLWKGTSGSSLPCDAAETFTDGQQIYRPIHSSDGQSFYTDGLQVYAPVCVMVMSPEQQQQQAGSTCDQSEGFLASDEESWEEEEEEGEHEEEEVEDKQEEN